MPQRKQDYDEQAGFAKPTGRKSMNLFIFQAGRHPVLFDGTGPDLAWRAALSTALAVLFLSGLLLRLPGLRPLWERRSLL